MAIRCSYGFIHVCCLVTSNKIVAVRSLSIRACSAHAVHVASFPGLSRFYVRLVHEKHEREEKFEKQESPSALALGASAWDH